MANNVRGEIDIKLGNETFCLAPTFDAIVRIEASLGKGLQQLVQESHGGRAGVRDAAVIIAACASAGGQQVTEAEVGEQLMSAKLVDVWARLREFLTAAIVGPTEKNAPAAASQPNE